MKNYMQVTEKLQDFAKGAKEVSAGIAKITPYVAAFGVAAAAGAPLTVATVLLLSAGAVEGASGVLSLLADPKRAFKDLSIQERFDLCFHILCQKAFAESINEILPELDEEIRSFAVDLRALEDPNSEDPIAARTTWAFESDLQRAAIPLFDAIGRRLAFFLHSARMNNELAGAMTAKLNLRARALLALYLTSPEASSQWIFNYVQMDVLNRVRDAHDSLPSKIAEAIHLAAEGFIDVERTAGPKKAWAEYRKYLQDMPDRDIFGTDIGIGKLYVLPNFNYYRQGQRLTSAGGKETEAIHLEVRGGVAPFLTHLITNRTQRDNLIFIFGEPGVGKTSLAQVYADGLSRHQSFHPIYIPLQHIDPEKNLIGEIEKYLQDSPLRNALKELPNCSNVVFILDAFDELAQATRDRLGNFFRELERFASDQLYRTATVIATGRDTLFSQGDSLIPSGTHVITLEPFDKGQIEEWSTKWNALTGCKFNGVAFWQDEDAKRNDLHDLAKQPLLLYLLAKLEQSGKPIDPSAATTSRAGVYRHLIQWSCDRQQEKTPGGSPRAMSSAQMRKLLRLTGFAMMSYGKRSVHIEELQQLISASGLSSEIIQQKSNYQAERTFLMFSFSKKGQSAWEFKHKQFGEYLAAEFLGEKLASFSAQNADLDEPNERQWNISDDNLGRSWVEVFGRNNVTAEVQAFLGTMLGGWKSFLENGAIEDLPARTATLRRLLKRCGTIFRRLCREQDAKALVEISTGGNLELTQALSNCLSASLSIGTLVASVLTSVKEESYFNLEEFAQDGWHKAINLIRSHEDLTAVLARRLFGRVSLASTRGIRLPAFFYPTVFLPFVKIPTIAKRDDPRLFDGPGMPGALFYGADLSGADFSDFSLDGANFNEANLTKSTFVNSKLKGASFINANLTSCSLIGANLRGSVLIYAKAIGADFRQCSGVGLIANNCDFSNADLRGSDFTGASLKDANFDGAQTEGAVFDKADLSGTRLEATHALKSADAAKTPG